MKKHILLLLSLSFLSLFSIAQNKKKPSSPKWLSEKGYWVIESNIKTPKNAIVLFYNNDHQVIYREKVEGMEINLNRRKTLMRLRQVLEEAYAKWENSHIFKENEQLVANALKLP